METRKELLEELEQIEKDLEKAIDDVDVALIEELSERKWRIELFEL